jgi:hypothetical protein
MRPSLQFAFIPLVALACKSDCLQTPCFLPIALTITVTASTSGAPVNDAFVQATGTTGHILCNQASGNTCYIFGGAGTYELEVGAPGFQSAQRTEVVGGNNPECGCASVDTKHIDVALLP